jgi:hypothetical protein
MPGKTSLLVYSKGLLNLEIIPLDTTSVPVSVICSTPLEVAEASVVSFPEYKADVDGATALSEVSITSSLEQMKAPEKWIWLFCPMNWKLFEKRENCKC